MTECPDVKVRLESFLRDELAAITENQDISLQDDAVLIGKNAIISSRELIELLLALEEYMESEFGVEFDWASDSAMSSARSNFRSVGVLLDHLSAMVGRKS